MKINSFLLAITSLSLAIHCTAEAAVSASEAAKLGDTLTPIGAEKAGNADGSIPPWTGGLDKAAASVDSASGRPADPFADEQPLFTITAENHEQYANRLSEGQRAMFMRYPQSYRMRVFPTHRSVSVPEHVQKAAARNAVSTTLVSNGDGLRDFETAIPFPIPQSAIEVMWNHLTRYRGGSARRSYVQATPTANGTYTPVHFKQQFAYRDQLNDFNPEDPGNVLFYYRELITAPARLAGNVVLVHETLDQVKEPRKAWIYNSGQRRVRRAPQISYDGPFPASEGQRTSDNLDMFNGALDRYDWKLLGKKELYIPYNNYQLESAELKYSDIVKPGHINADLPRYELHRVWIVEGTLKADARHIYAKRIAYIDEDSWQIVLLDHYDARGALWRVGEGFMTPLFDKQIPMLGVEALYDLINGRYIVSGMRNEERDPLEFGFKVSSAEYTPTALRNAGVR
ncbi:DUF1329 domain-containing protein [Ectopseudomonas hydrolytica]|uniref:DUF1329 domain-containing protein n=1 Tax=Ectopseudomonas hydrolytica TaxID=2493633 RepID=UPI000BC2FB30|nr:MULTISPECIES: DUF1329 domain-containing protein [Pseudomonas]ARS50024.1 hypothetical protein PSMEN_17125 [Pseudomonas mendocina]ATH81235.1 outer membrane lipoprotein-sorting protein [Pseudomonas mendocina]MBF8161920.1 DUF1329 domain-containing protein [Pseudomonas mendocina]UTH30471.1 DUF1329 domain-containing protein [Pseudomonas hydrolytica]UTH35255.1 DUF1329 domain-containing protein [Pseudomonas sp. KHPS1]